jgi:PAS domain S-box-containing protein
MSDLGGSDDTVFRSPQRNEVPLEEAMVEKPGGVPKLEQHLNDTKRVFLLIAILAFVTFVTVGIAIYVLYRTALAEAQERLVETAQSQARLIEAVARFDSLYSSDYPQGAKAATLHQIKDAHGRYRGFGETGEFTLARREGDNIVFLLSHRHLDLEQPRPVPFNASLAEPMRRALEGESGTVIGLDYRGEVVVAAHEPVSEVDMGIVAKIDLDEIQAPFVRAGLVSTGVACLAIFLGAFLFGKVTDPMIRRLESRTAESERLNLKLRQEITDRKVVEAALSESEQRYRSVFEQAGDPSFLLTLDGGLVDVNQGACEALGYTREELLRLSLEAIEPAYLPEQFQSFVRALKTGTPITIETVHQRKDGSVFPVEIRAGLIELQGVWHLLSLARDISERKRAEEAIHQSEERLRYFVRHTPAAVAMLNRKMEYVLLSNRWLEDFKFGGMNIVGLSHCDVFPDFQERWKGILYRCLEGAVEKCSEDIVERADGSIDWLRWEVHPWKDDTGKIGGLVIFAELITEAKQMAQELNSARELAAVGEMAASVAHQIKNPLGAISGVVEVLQDSTPPNDPHREVMDELVTRVQRVDSTVNSLLRFSKPWTVDKIELDLTRIVELVVASVGREEEFEGISFQVDGEKGSRVPVDVVLIQDVLGNLLHNSTRAMPDGGEIHVSLVNEPKAVVLKVADTGNGMPPEVVGKLFRPFFTTDSQGTGLGLLFCKRVVEAHGGSITVASEVGRGTEVTLSLPRKQ